MKIIACGDRHWESRLVILSALANLPSDTIVIDGGCSGADSIAMSVAKHDLGLKTKTYPANWDAYGRKAGPIRNQQMLDDETPDLVMAFHDNIEKSRGTKDMVNRATKRNIPVLIYDSQGRSKVIWQRPLGKISEELSEILGR